MKGKGFNMRWCPVLVFVLGVVVASPADIRRLTNAPEEILEQDSITRNSLIEGQLRNLLEDLRKTMLTGSSAVPVLDPLEIPSLAVDQNDVPIPGLRLALENTKVNKLSTFVIDELTVRRPILSLDYRVTLDFQIPVIELAADHYNLAVLIDGAQVFGSGDAKINLIEPRLKGGLLVRPSLGLGSLHLRIRECDLQLTLQGFDSHISGLLGGDAAMDAFINNFLGFFVPDLVKLYEVEISDTLNTLVMEYGNELLADINLVDIIG